MKWLNLIRKLPGIIMPVLATLSVTSLVAQDQEINYYQFRKVDPAKIDEFVKRETTYWSKVAEKGIANGKMEFWGLFEKVSGGNADSPNFLFVNSFKDIDEALKGEMWDPSKLFPGVPITKIETNSISTVTKTLLTASRSWEQSPKVTKSDDMKFVLINYHHATDPEAFITLENKHWQPFIKGEMAAGRTAQLAWGNQLILSPSSGKDGPTTISVDLYPTFKDALMPRFADDAKIPVEGLTELQKLTTAPRDIEIYRIVKIVAKN